MNEDIAPRVQTVLDSIAEAAVHAGRNPAEITLVAASKMNDSDRVRAAAAAGISVFGENRVQEMLEKNQKGAYSGARLQFIGHLQKNKVKNVVGLAELIQGVDSLPLLDCISKTAETLGIVQDVLLEVNIGNEPSKSGFSPDFLASALEHSAALKGIRIRGLMAIPPVCISEKENLLYFNQMMQLFVDIGEKKYDNSSMDFLSMGMTHDYRAAISCGSNMVRIGTGIFGPRNYGQTP